MDNQAIYYMREAISEAVEGITNEDGGPFGAVIVKDGKIVGRGHNRVLKNNDPTCHGEMEAIRDACKNLGTYDLSGCTLYTTAECCPMCLAGSMWANIENIVYGCTVADTDNLGFRDGNFYERISNKDMYNAWCKNFDRLECMKVFDKYAKMHPTIY